MVREYPTFMRRRVSPREGRLQLVLMRHPSLIYLPKLAGEGVVGTGAGGGVGGDWRLIGSSAGGGGAADDPLLPCAYLKGAFVSGRCGYGGMYVIIVISCLY